MKPRNLQSKALRFVKILGGNIVVLLVLLTGAELGMRVTDCKTTLFDFNEAVEFEKIFAGDADGITTFINQRSARLPWSFSFGLNPQGFFSPYDFEKQPEEGATENTKILLLGDSYTEGCCAESKAFSYSQLLDKTMGLRAFNTGIGGTDPLQYRLVLQKYLPILKPDLIMAFIYLGNDLLSYPREPRPCFPMNIAIKGNGLLKSEVYYGDSLYQFESEHEAYQWHVNTLTFKGSDQSDLKQWIGKSYLLSYLYQHIEVLPKINQNDPIAHQLPYTNQELKKMAALAKVAETPIRFIAIPSVQDVINQVDLKKRYSFVFEGLNWDAPDLSTFWKGDYDGLSVNNHFNRMGHIKFYFFLLELLVPPEEWPRYFK